MVGYKLECHIDGAVNVCECKWEFEKKNFIAEFGEYVVCSENRYDLNSL